MNEKQLIAKFCYEINSYFVQNRDTFKENHNNIFGDVTKEYSSNLYILETGVILNKCVFLVRIYFIFS
jgi:hypothetical protein